MKVDYFVDAPPDFLMSDDELNHPVRRVMSRREYVLAHLAEIHLSGTRTDGSEYCIIHDHVTKPAPPAKKLHGQETLD